MKTHPLIPHVGDIISQTPDGERFRVVEGFIASLPMVRLERLEPSDERPLLPIPAFELIIHDCVEA